MKFDREQGGKGDFNPHKTVKPLSFCEYIINLTTYSNEAVVLDPFAGSGTTLVAAKKTGRKFIGIDINKEYIEIAIRRIKPFEVDSSRYNAVSEEKQLRILEKKVAYKKSNKVKILKAV